MPLSDREQKILAEIERHFHAEDPNLVRAVRRIDRQGSRLTRWATVGIIAGLVLMAFTVTSSTLVAVIGFLLVVVSGNHILQVMLNRRREADDAGDDVENISRNKGRRRFRRD